MWWISPKNAKLFVMKESSLTFHAQPIGQFGAAISNIDLRHVSDKMIDDLNECLVKHKVPLLP